MLLSFLGVVCVEVISLLAHIVPVLEPYFFVAVIVAVVCAALRRLEYGLYAAFTELMIGSWGYVLALNVGGVSLSLRVGIFVCVMGIWFVRFLLDRKYQSFLSFPRLLNSSLRVPIIFSGIFFLFLIWGVINGFLSGNDRREIFFDVNGFLYYAYFFPLFETFISIDRLKTFLSVLLGALWGGILKMFVLLYLFSHPFFLPILKIVYTWVRDTRVGEITKVQEPFYRIFFQSQIYALMIFFILTVCVSVFYILPQVKKASLRLSGVQLFWYGHMVIFGAVLLMSFSRSFWVAGLAASLVWIIIFSWYSKSFWKGIFLQGCLIFSTIFLALILIVITVKFPIPSAKDFNALDVFSSRAFGYEDEAALSTRFQMLPPLWNSISGKFFFGKGFGAAVTYVSNDPTVRKQTGGSGVITTSAFEWGYLDQWLKMGFLGMMAYLTFLCAIGYRGVRQFFAAEKRGNQEFVAYLFGMLLSFFALLAVHMFTPYLNHPLGIAYVMAVAVIIERKLLIDVEREA